ncbi:hypothetical protein AgCh_002596 [Apium graveolens]
MVAAGEDGGGGDGGGGDEVGVVHGLSQAEHIVHATSYFEPTQEFEATFVGKNRVIMRRVRIGSVDFVVIFMVGEDVS